MHSILPSIEAPGRSTRVDRVEAPMRLGVKAIIDILFKKIFGSREHPKTTLALLNAILEAIGRPLAKSVAILNPYELAQFEGNKDSVLDIKAEDEGGRTFQVEMQVRAYPGLGRRMLGNWASVYAGQLGKGQRDSEHLPVISIWFVGSPFLPESNWIETWTARGDTTGRVLDGDFLIVTVDLARWRRLREGAEDGIFKSRLERWLYLITESEKRPAS